MAYVQHRVPCCRATWEQKHNQEKNNIKFSPELPWTAETQEGTIQLENAVTLQDIAENKLAFIIQNNPQNTMLGCIQISTTQFIIDDEDDEHLYEGTISQDGKTITLNRLSEISSYYLESVQVIDDNVCLAVPDYPLPWNKEAYLQLYPQLTLQEIMDGGLTIETDDRNEPQLEWEDNEHQEIKVILGGDTIWRIYPVGENTYWLAPSQGSLPSGPSITAITF